MNSAIGRLFFGQCLSRGFVMGRRDMGANSGKCRAEDSHVVGKPDKGEKIRYAVQRQDKIGQCRQQYAAHPVRRVQIERTIIGRDNVFEKGDLPSGLFDRAPELVANPVFLATTGVVIARLQDLTDFDLFNQLSVPLFAPKYGFERHRVQVQAPSAKRFMAFASLKSNSVRFPVSWVVSTTSTRL